jgi:hypothetical protein
MFVNIFFAQVVIKYAVHIGKGKAIPVKVYIGLEGSWRLSAPHTGCLYPPGNIVQPEGLSE